MNDIFRSYANYYDLIYKSKDYTQEAEYLIELMKSYTPESKNLLEMGCGTGLHAQALASKGFSVHGIDLSEQMIAEAKKRSLSNTTFEVADIRSWRSNQIYDSVFSLFHVFSYQTTNNDLKTSLNTAECHLKEGGVLIFDFWFGPSVLTHRPQTTVKKIESNETVLTRVAQPDLNPNLNCVDIKIDIWHQKNGGSSFSYISESHKLRYLFVPEIQLMIENTSFELVDVFEWGTTKKPDTDSWSAVVILQKLYCK